MVCDGTWWFDELIFYDLVGYKVDDADSENGLSLSDTKLNTLEHVPSRSQSRRLIELPAWHPHLDRPQGSLSIHPALKKRPRDRKERGSRSLPLTPL
jgi:hypothetical protein